MSGREPDLPGLLSGPVLVVAGVLASPAYLRLAQGLLTVQEALTRVLVVTAVCIAAWGAVRLSIPVLLGRAAPGADVTEPVTGVVVDPTAPTQVLDVADHGSSPPAGPA
ncbi:hypothetical protein [Nocardioides sp. TF02-7]|uniref:hypothetical protein n=1 Tax=Nocardioides sp. TF02-7 TaxID=2917724 RepID=UPI001F0576B9|nr:hypothetical protein [Nocardioides sp. TF02-7]UMG92973.1 hypothetical protein MF408_01000 [Nocardioides sp. TF02-7]